MKNLKKIAREELKSINGGRPPGGSYGDMCSPGTGDVCAQYGLECGLYIGRDHAVGEWAAFRCM